MHEPRPWIQWFLMWGLLLAAWIGLQNHVSLPPWTGAAESPLPLQPRIPQPVTREGHLQSIQTDLSLNSWDFLDSVQINLPVSWQLTGNARSWSELKRFFQKLPEADCQRIEIYHWGDSQIEGDRITQNLRDSWQSRWGGRGPGWVLPITPASSTALVGSVVDGSINRTSGFGRGQKANALRLPFMATNEVQDSAMWKVRGNGRASLTNKGWTWTNIWSNNTGKATLSPKATASTLDSLSWNHAPVMGDLSMALEPQEIHGIFLGQKHGVYVHNLPLRGSSGTLFTNVPESDWLRMKKEHPPALFILQFGGNAVPGIQSSQQARWFAKKLAKNIRLMQQLFPAVPVIFIGPSDMGKSTKPFVGLPLVIHALKAEILTTGAMYWDLQSAMGGPGSMANWVRQGWASKDHIHFTRRGAKEAGERFEQALYAACQSFRNPEMASYSKGTSVHSDFP